MAGRALEERVFVISRQKGHISLCSYLQILTASAFHPHIPPAQLRTHLCREKNHLLLWRRGCRLCCRSQLLWNLFSMFVGTAMFWSTFPHYLWVLRQVKIVSTWVGNARTNTPNWGWHQQVIFFWFQHVFLSPQKWEWKFLVSSDVLLWWLSSMEGGVNFRSRGSGRSWLCVSPKKLNY